MPNALIITAVEDKEKHGNRLPGLSPAALSAGYSFAINEISSEGTAWLVFANDPGAQGTRCVKGVPVHNFLQSVALL
jgi:hypothetical protein